MFTIKAKRYVKKGLAACAVLWFFAAVVQQNSKVAPSNLDEVAKVDYGTYDSLLPAR